MHIDETFLVFISLIIFVITLICLRVPTILFSFLDCRADGIRDDLLMARNSLEEAKITLIKHKERYSQIEQEVLEIISSAENKVKIIDEESQIKIKNIFDLRLADLERRIHRMELEAKHSFYAKLTDCSMDLSKRIIAEKMSDSLNSQIFQKGISDIKSHFG
ncbi:MAG: F0F1 ATP synthase subunit B [Candidatus Liberibacter europaeus]|uniref:F0F1 ATP synthase subunit B n=1 Tax=Candidatus Liberibacter europaeus TaxID=744859 RepID=A0A2T4VWJ5_9HYPH|nr:F0F1 ATP synthase subunit B [Candidatus Liberibacter europaeus]PTL86149.1 MAG: F0F1 ATP synthase subunit B [Candidatus Liberibacter europaeus]